MLCIALPQHTKHVCLLFVFGSCFASLLFAKEKLQPLPRLWLNKKMIICVVNLEVPISPVRFLQGLFYLRLKLARISGKFFT